MPLGVIVNNRTAAPARGLPTNTGTAHVVIEADQGSLTEAKLLRSLADFEAEYGARETANAESWDWLDVFFREGGRRAYAARVDFGGAGTLATGYALLDKGKGPGQLAIAAPTPTIDEATIEAGFAEARAKNRVFLVDPPTADDTVAELNTFGDLADTDQSYGAIFGPRVLVPAPAGVVGGTERTVPASAVVAALCQRADLQGNPNRAAAGRDFPLQYVTGFAQTFSDADRETMLGHGINTFADVYGVLELYGFQTTIDEPVGDDADPYWQFNASRGRMWLTAMAQVLGEGFMFKPIDGKGRLQEALKGAIAGACLDLYNVDGLFGETPEDAFAVEVGASVNTVGGIAQGELHAACEVIWSPHTKSVVIDLVSVPVTGRVSQSTQ